MSRITNLKRQIEEGKEKVKEISWEKFKVDVGQHQKKSMPLILKKFKPNIDLNSGNLTIEDIASIFNSNLEFFRVNFFEVSDWSSDRLRTLLPKKYRLFSGGIPIVRFEIELKGEFTLDDVNLYAPLGAKLMANSCYNMYHRVSRQGDVDYTGRYYSKFMDLEYVWCLLRCLEYFYKEIQANQDMLGNKNSSFFKHEYTSKDTEDLLNISYIEKHTCYPEKRTMQLIYDCIMSIAYRQSSTKLNAQYSKNLSADYAKSYETKKNIPQKQLDIMESTKLLDSFSFVEIDELTDIQKFNTIEEEFLKAKNLLNLEKFFKDNIPELRFRRLGNHKATGLYYPIFRCICIDISAPSSFIHELGHHIDYCFDEKELSLQHNFRFVAMEYQDEFDKSLELCEDVRVSDYCKRKRGYFHTPTEIFARCLEIYLVCIKNTHSSFLKKPDEMVLSSGFPTLTKSLLEKIGEYYSKLFDIDENLDTTVNIANIPTPLEESILSNTNIEDICETQDTSISFDSTKPDEKHIAFGFSGQENMFSCIRSSMSNSELKSSCSAGMGRSKLSRARNKKKSLNQISFFN